MRTTIFPANFEQLDSIRDFVATAARECGMGGKDVYSVCLAVDEAASNIIEHAYGGAAEAVIEITCEVAEGELTVILRDHGEPFDPSLVPPLDVTADLKDREIGGLGMFLMRKMMDKVNFESSPETGNVLTMVKRLSKPRRIDESGEKPDWRIVFRLGEAILGAPTFADQCDLILESARRLVSGAARLDGGAPLRPPTPDGCHAPRVQAPPDRAIGKGWMGDGDPDPEP
jgi:serine/threonine-protein kinase RsbW